MIKPPFNYTGSKHKVASQMVQHLPAEFGRVQVMFGGALGDVVNIFPDGTNVWAFDNNKALVEMIKAMRDSDKFENFVRAWISLYGLNRTDEKAYYDLRSKYNALKTTRPNSGVLASMLFALVAHAFNNYMRFNSAGGFNVPFGKRTYNTTMQANFRAYVDKLNKLDLTLMPRPFTEMAFDATDFVLADPPYLTGVAPYNASWTEKDELQLLATLDAIDAIGGKFMLINAVANNQRHNWHLLSWMQKYRTVTLNNSYVGSNHQRGGWNTTEVLVMNYK